MIPLLLLGCLSSSRPLLLVCRTGGYPEDWAALSDSTWTPGDLRVGAIGIKLGMTHTWDSWGKRIPLTAIQLKVNRCRLCTATHACCPALVRSYARWGGWWTV